MLITTAKIECQQQQPRHNCDVTYNQFKMRIWIIVYVWDMYYTELCIPYIYM